MEQMYQDYKDVAEFYLVYIREAHAADSKWPVQYAKDQGIKEHTNFGERCTVAQTLIKEKKLTMPCLIDDMDNAVGKAYAGWPDRIFLVRKDGKLAVAAKRGPWGFKPGLDEAKKWLAAYRKTGKEPALPTPEDKAQTKQVAPPEGEKPQKDPGEEHERRSSNEDEEQGP